MGNRLSKIYTRTGDDGTTGMADGSRSSKADVLFDAMGDIDELNAHLGKVRAKLNADDNADTACYTTYDKTLSIIQHLLFNIGGELAMSNCTEFAGYEGVTQAHIDWLEAHIDTMNSNLSNLKEFILPAGSSLCAEVHIARTICRRAERQTVKLNQRSPNTLSITSSKFINRLSDWLFVFAREVLRLAKIKEVLWQKDILKTI